MASPTPPGDTPSPVNPATEDADQQASASPQSSPTSAKPKFSRLSLDTPDRVFPIRSVISVDPTVSNRSTSQSPPPQSHNPPQHSSRAFSPKREDSREYSIDETVWSQIHQSQKDDEGLARTTSDVSHPLRNASEQEVATNITEEKASGLTAKHPALDNIPGHLSSDGASFTSSADGGVPVASQDPPRSTTQAQDELDLVTSRFQHVVTEAGHAIITGRDGANFQYCEDEPIHIPGAVQSFGALIALEEESEGKLVVRVASENSASLIGYTPKQLFALGSFTDILSEEQEDNILDHIDFIRDEACDPRVHGPEVFILSIANPAGEMKKFWCAMHVNDANKNLIICEFEFEDDLVNPLNVSGQTTPDAPSDTLGIDPSPEELAASTINMSRPLRVLRNARRGKGEAAAMKVFNILTQIQEQLSAASTLDLLLNTAAGLVKELTGFHRIMIYQFDSSWNGMVVAELVDTKATKDLYKGLHFPASDIPKQARELYKINKVRLLYDRDLVTSRLVCRTVKDLETPLDMTHAYLRAMSPIHIKYLSHMDVRASMSTSIVAFNELWGLITCHSYGASGMRVSFPVRKMCRLIGDTVSRNIERLSYTSRLQARKLINTIPTETNPSGYIIASSDDLLKLFDADYGALSIRDETKILGRLTHSHEVLALLEYLKVRQLSSVMASHDVNRDFPDLRYPPGFKHISGLLYVPLSAGGKDFIVFFRRGQLTEIKWAGNPYEKKMRSGTSGYLEPRQSFQTWRETVMSRSREWTETDVETAAVLCLVYGKFIEVWRQKEAAMQNTQLTKLLLANSAHEVRTPLNAIINHLEIALEGSLDSETRDNLARSHSASKSLIYVLNDLLDLTNTEKGQNLIKDEIFDLTATFTEATDMFDCEAKRKNITYNVKVYPGVPKSVFGDQRRIRQVIVNLISNAIQHTESGSVSVEMWRSPVQSAQPIDDQEKTFADVEVTVHDTGSGMSQATIDNLFRNFEQVSSEDESYYYEKDSAEDSPEGGEKRVLGLGLALVARIIRNMHGQLSVKSEEGAGSRFKMMLKFPVPSDEHTQDRIEQEDSGLPSTPPVTKGEVLLVDSNVRPKANTRRYSAESNRSGGSMGSSRSGRSEADRLISAIQEPALVSKPESSEPRRSKHSSPESSFSKSRSFDMSTLAIASPESRKNSGPISLPSPDLRHRISLGSPPIPGQEPVTDSGVPISALRVDETQVERPASPKRIATRDRAESNAVLSEGSITELTSPVGTGSDMFQFVKLHVLIAEDDPVNSKIIQKRFQRLGHSVYLTVNGEECVTAYKANPKQYDVVLMDIQMPIVDGMGATKMIREFEQKSSESTMSEKAKPFGRVPIFAVSASLVERDAQKYIDTGFDGYIMKPIDFKRVNSLLCGLQGEQQERDALTYVPGNWEHGGWFNQ
ncbi:putative sensor histidine kinase/response regulator [Talaromyces proteolyticus]|uniref:Sensor histidine kinase/response regulator n=1 Tax=Talaromyces proteolyticus TaxID=1131652 RepID=A0AAD4Q0V9_9EURO|nr:putative sensor histidine kinase/response regulator [Talaromyces proteolyticus]KAH8704935.1 putative sensor histidine kinase/response regulator [Talaromyces proteolyticus]